jgi:hypothetical protein
MLLNAGMPDCMVSIQSGTGMNKNVWLRTKGIQSGTGMLQDRTEMLRAGIPMPVALDSMPMPSYDVNIHKDRDKWF